MGTWVIELNPDGAGHAEQRWAYESYATGAALAKFFTLLDDDKAETVTLTWFV